MSDGIVVSETVDIFFAEMSISTGGMIGATFRDLIFDGVILVGLCGSLASSEMGNEDGFSVVMSVLKSNGSSFGESEVSVAGGS